MTNRLTLIIVLALLAVPILPAAAQQLGGNEMLTPQQGGFITEYGATALRMYVGGNDTLYHGQLVEPDPASTSSDSLKVRRAQAGSTNVIGVVYFPWCDTCMHSDSRVLVVTGGIAQCLVNPKDSMFSTKAGNFLSVATDAEYPGYHRVSVAAPQAETGKTLGKKWIVNATGENYIAGINQSLWMRFYVMGNVHFNEYAAVSEYYRIDSVNVDLVRSGALTTGLSTKQNTITPGTLGQSYKTLPEGNIGWGTDTTLSQADLRNAISDSLRSIICVDSTFAFTVLSDTLNLVGCSEKRITLSRSDTLYFKNWRIGQWYNLRITQASNYTLLFSNVSWIAGAPTITASANKRMTVTLINWGDYVQGYYVVES